MLAVGLLEMLGVLVQRRLVDPLVADLGADPVAPVAQLHDPGLLAVELGGALVDPLLGAHHLAL